MIEVTIKVKDNKYLRNEGVVYCSHIFYNYINESTSTNSFDIRAIHLSWLIITTSPLKNIKN
jgi:inorganic pyrophosphatase/exopolyphosphatase